MTPFELSLENELHSEVQRFSNDWLFQWYGMTYEDGKTDVEDFAGGRIRYGGIKFGYQQEQIFWQAIDRYLVQRVHAAYGRWEAETKEYPPEVRKKALEGPERQLGVSVRRLHDMDRSGWWFLLWFTLVGGLVLIYWACQPGTAGPNRFGEARTK